MRYHLANRPTVYLPPTPEAYSKLLTEFLQAERVTPPEAFSRNARRFMYFQLFRTSLPFDRYLEKESYPPGFVRLRDFTWQDLLPERSPTIQALLDGLLNGKPFYLQD